MWEQEMSRRINHLRNSVSKALVKYQYGQAAYPNDSRSTITLFKSYRYSISESVKVSSDAHDLLDIWQDGWKGQGGRTWVSDEATSSHDLSKLDKIAIAQHIQKSGELGVFNILLENFC